jgi:hypothetical protein
MTLEEFPGLVGNIQEYAVGPQAFHLVVDGTGHHVPRGQFPAIIEARHKALSIRQQQLAPLAAYRLGDQE